MSDHWTRDKFDWLDAVAADPHLPATASRLAIILMRYMNRTTGDAWPSVARLAADMSTAQNTVRTALKAMQDHGYLTVEIGGGIKSNRYRMTADPCKFLKGAPLQVTEGVENSAPSENCTAPLQKTAPHPFNLLKTNPLNEPTEEPTEKYIFGAGAPSTSEAFEKFWSVYPKKIGKASARRAFETAVKNGTDPETIIEGAFEYRDQRIAAEPTDAAERDRFTLNPAKFITDQRYLDEPAPVAPAMSPEAKADYILWKL